MPNRRRIAVVGVGSVGGYFGAQAAAAGHDVVLCSRRPFEGLRVETGGDVLDVDAPVLTDPADATPVDWVLLATKAHQTAATAPWLAALCRPGTVVAVLQNGVDHVERVAPLVDEADVLPTIVKYGGELLEPGLVRHHTYGFLTAPATDAGEALVDLFAASAPDVVLTDDFTTEAWRKLCTNVAANAVPALTMRRFPVFRRPDVAELARGLITEAATVGAREGASLPATIADDEVARMAALPDGVGSSMLYDRLAGRALEHEALNGAVVRAGERHGVPTPLNAAVTALLAAISEEAAG